ncbi:response regulator aspartate phosphatase [Geomicrobium sp. JCM 19037]|uniref:tetratricopeptide repeat protein n=2 Tax=unclassified Geomicrobium TaxID=2628951 RepID=UPI00045F1ADC|nr:tetratricopeptide repeat protein [Geomicrobium sp. JCM 19037]GAK06266.1 response regulator aspartate phosphatase [Geomicrobium sp. JCM 19037]
MTREVLNEPVQPKTFIEDAIRESDTAIQYLGYYVKGFSDFSNERYSQALESFIQAERLLSNINPLEQADFYLRTSACYYRLSQYPLALAYAKEAQRIFKPSKKHYRQTVNTMVLISGIKQDTFTFDLPNKYFDDCLMHAADDSYTESIVFRAKGLYFMKQEKLHISKRAFENALKLQINHRGTLSIKTECDLAYVCFKLDFHTEGIHYLNNARHQAEQAGLIEQISRCMFMEGFFHPNGLNQEQVDQSLEMLSSHGLHYDLGELVREVRLHYVNDEDFHTAHKYSSMLLETISDQQKEGILT